MNLPLFPYPNIDNTRPAWRKWDSNHTQECRGCGKEMRRGYRAMGIHLPDPYLCGECWTLGIAIEFR